MVAACEAVQAEVERLRSDLDFATEVPRGVHLGAVKWAAELWQARSAPSGFAGYGDGADLMGSMLASQRADIYRLIGIRRPLTA